MKPAPVRVAAPARERDDGWRGYKEVDVSEVPDIYMGGFSTEWNPAPWWDKPAPAPGYYFRTAEDCIAYMCDELVLTGDLTPIFSDNVCQVFKATAKQRTSDEYLYIWRVSPYLVKERSR